ncbi:MAG: AraC family transcriptional regulator [Elainellaceae cyanobacterium]
MNCECQSKAIDLAQKNALASILPYPARFSSHELAWEGLHLEHHHQPAHRQPPHHFLQHVIKIPALPAYSTGKNLKEHVSGYELSQSDLHLVPACTDHQDEIDRECEFTLLAIEPEPLAQTMAEMVDGDRLRLISQGQIHDPLIRQIGLALKAEAEKAEAQDLFYVEAALTLLHAHLVKHYSDASVDWQQPMQGLGRGRLKKAIDYINTHLDQNLKLSEIAAVIGMSQYYFCRLFKQSVGLSPYQYLTKQRIKRAKQLLKTLDLSIADIALQCGFSNQSQLTKHFKQQTGTTPKAYRFETLD